MNPQYATDAKGQIIPVTPPGGWRLLTPEQIAKNLAWFVEWRRQQVEAAGQPRAKRRTEAEHEPA